MPRQVDSQGEAKGSVSLPRDLHSCVGGGQTAAALLGGELICEDRGLKKENISVDLALIRESDRKPVACCRNCILLVACYASSIRWRVEGVRNT